VHLLYSHALPKPFSVCNTKKPKGDPLGTPPLYPERLLQALGVFQHLRDEKLDI
jgi:hypothetical protein